MSPAKPNRSRLFVAGGALTFTSQEAALNRADATFYVAKGATLTFKNGTASSVYQWTAKPLRIVLDGTLDLQAPFVGGADQTYGGEGTLKVAALTPSTAATRVTLSDTLTLDSPAAWPTVNADGAETPLTLGASSGRPVIHAANGWTYGPAAGTTTTTTPTDRAAYIRAGATLAVEPGGGVATFVDPVAGSGTLEITNNRTVTINMNNHTLDRKLTGRPSGAGQVFTVREGSTLNLNGGTVKGGWGGAGGGINNEGTTNLTNVNITGNTADDRGGGISNHGTLTMTGGSITNNISNDGTDPKGGGGIMNSEGATATLTNVTITGNTVNVTGGGGICNYGTMTLDGCTVTGNSCKMNGGGIWNKGTLKMQGVITVTGNTTANSVTNNLFLKTDAVVTVTSSLTGSNVGIIMEKPGVFTSGYSTYNSGVDPADIFKAEDEAYQIVLKGEEANFFGKLITVTTEDELRTAVKTENARGQQKRHSE